MISLFLNFFKRIYAYRSVIRAMALREIQTRYTGTLAGVMWSVINPLMMILVYWFIFSVGFKIRPEGDIPFIVVFLCGLLPWTMFSETLIASRSAITGNLHLVKKTVFPTEILPIVNLVASSITHIIMLIILIFLLSVNKISISFYNLQFFYYLAALSIFILGLSWLISATNVFCRDVGQILVVLLNLWFWMTPIVWATGMLPQRYQLIIKLNPIYYIVDGYRASFIYHVPFWHNYRLGIYFWAVTLLVFIAGATVFRKLKFEFADVL